MPKSALSLEVAELFYGICNDLYMRWKIYRHLFDDNVDQNKLQFGDGARCLDDIGRYMHGSVLLELCKLHDPIVQSDRVNLTIGYVVDLGGWEPGVRTELLGLKKEMESLFGKIKLARNKLIAHNDLQTILEGTVLGQFKKDADIQYFRNLERFVGVIFRELTGRPRPFYDLVTNEAEAFRQVLLRGWNVVPDE